MNFSFSVQFSCGYFLADMAMMFHHYPNLGRLEFVSYTVLLQCVCSNPDGAELQIFYSPIDMLADCYKSTVYFGFIFFGLSYYSFSLRVFHAVKLRGKLRFVVASLSWICRCIYSSSKWHCAIVDVFGCQFVHHLLSIISLVLGVHSGHGQVYIFMVLLSECTTPFVNLRWWVICSLLNPVFHTATDQFHQLPVIQDEVKRLAWLQD
jgi:hypothetical protein